MDTISSEELGRRRFQVLRDKAAEEALEKIRKALSERDRPLTGEESVAIRNVLREIWSGTDPETWGSFSFSSLSEDDIGATLAIGKGVKDRRDAVSVMADSLKKILVDKMH